MRGAMSTFDDELLAPIDTLRGYDRWAPTYDHDPNALVSATSWVLDRAPLGVADCDVLELGCGTGRNVARVLGEGARSYLGIDGSHGMLSIAAQRHADPRVSFGVSDLTAPWSLPHQFDFALIVLLLEHIPVLDPLLVSLARVIRPGGRLRIVDLHPERIAAGAFAHFQDGTRNVHFSSVAHAVPMLCGGLDAIGFETVRRDWLAGETMAAEVPGLAQHRGTRLVLDVKATRRVRDRRGSGAL
jgi:SAM-dependent methyltransferase